MQDKAGPSKQKRVTIKEVLDEDCLDQATKRLPSCFSTLPTATEDAARESMGSCTSTQSNRSPPNHLQRFKGMYVKEFPEPLAGAPVSDEHVPPLDLGAYMKLCGPMAELEHFEVAKLLMTSGMSNVAKDCHLKSRMYRNWTPWPHCDAMLSDVDKLAHGPDFRLDEVNIFDG
ncbi:unnamed protein product [Rhizoctonia solani]|uniref:Uncharacterized protein n=1 Tax=Rhizoctonia solani TaxID=456999 RepID=A0A8H3BQQ3_9AGAM|nr:unnamed protein product [Rhizoctonia solani]